MSALLLVLACGADPLPMAPVDKVDELPAGIHGGSVDAGAAWRVYLEAGQPLSVGALSDDAELVLSVQSPNGERAVATSRRDEHRAASLRVEAATAGVYLVRVEGQLASARGQLTAVRKEPMTGDLCEQLTALNTGDSWSLPGAEHASDSALRRTRTLVGVMPWADECTVNRLADLDVGPSCARSGLSKSQADALYTEVEAAFRACHRGWLLTDESDPMTTELVAERADALHFVRKRDNGERGWQVSTGAMPSP